jgi:DNA-binding MarR family transcriptional regulator
MSRAKSFGPIADPLSIDEQLCFPLYAAANSIVKAYRPLLKPLGLTYPQYLVMLVLWEFGPLSVGDIGSRLLLDSGTLTPLLKRLESVCLVKRHRSANDERRVIVNLTEVGSRLKIKAQDVPEALACRILNAPIDARRLRRDLRALLEALNDGSAKIFSKQQREAI